MAIGILNKVGGGGGGGSTLFQGTWDAAINNPNLLIATPNPGDWWRVSVAGATNLSGITNWGIGDSAFWNGSVWLRDPLFYVGATKTTILTITTAVPALTALSVAASGVYHTLSGDATNLGSPSTTFDNVEYIEVKRNGVSQRKTVDVIYVTATSIQFAQPLSVGEEIILYS